MKLNEILELTEQLADKMDIRFDKFYTKPETAKYCISKLNLKKYDRIIEPSAGNGSFSKQIPGCEAYDLAPESKGIKKQDFLKFKAEKGNTLVIGNPPFGKANKLTLEFIKKASTFAKTIAFIIPNSCKKRSFIDRLPPNVHIRKVYDLPKKAFLVNGTMPYDVPCSFFIFDVNDNKDRKPFKEYETKDFDFVKKGEEDFSVLKKGYKVGRVLAPDSKISDADRMFIKSHINVETLKKRFNELKHPQANDVLGSESLSQWEMLRDYNKRYKLGGLIK